MPGFSESNITLDFPDNSFFRLADCPAYQRLSGNHFKEMDACWYDTGSGIFWLLELKDYSQATLSGQTTIDQKAWDLVKKAVDSLCMVLASRHTYPNATHLINCFPIVPDMHTELKFVSIIHCNSAQNADIQLLNEVFKQKFKSYADLFGIRYFTVIRHDAAIRHLSTFVK